MRTAMLRVVGKGHHQSYGRVVVAAERTTGRCHHQTFHRFASTASEWEYFKGPPEVTSSGVAIITLDNKAAKMNTLNDGLQKEAERLWAEHVDGRANVKAAVFVSGKKDNFIAGADINMLKQRKVEKQEDSLYEACMSGHALFDRLRKPDFPLVAAIHGSCLGGGLEWALKCDSRVCTSSPKTKMGLPEVKLGLLPGWGGTYALPRLVGLMDALPLILQGSEVRPAKAKKLGLVDAVCDQPSLLTVAVAKAEELAKPGGLAKLEKARAKKRNSLKRYVSEKISFFRNYILDQAKKQVDKTTRGKYAAPYKILDCVGFGLQQSDPKKAFDHEAKAFVELAKTDTSTALMGLFDGLTATKKNRFASSAGGGDSSSGGKKATVCVVGAGLMGAGIAQVSAEKGLEVVLKDRDASSVGKGVSYISDNLQKKVKRKRLSEFDKNVIVSRVHGYTDQTMDGFARRAKTADVVVEAVFEKLELKHQVLGAVEKLVPETCVIATNTSALPIADVAKGLEKTDRVLGMHYFSPVPQMQLLEIIPHANTSEAALRVAFQVGIDQGKTCVLVKDVPGFYVNRALAPQMAEIGPLFADGVDPLKLDEAILQLGMPVGPITLLDEVGADVGLHVQRTMVADPTMEDRMAGADPEMLQEIVDRGWLGRKSGKGFFLYGKKDAKKKKDPNPEALDYVKTKLKHRDLDMPLADIQDRYLARFVNEAAVCLQEGIVDSPRDADLAAVFGVGFLPFTGGPFRMLDIQGTDKYVDRMRFLADTYGPRFQPCQLLIDHALSGKKFYSSS